MSVATADCERAFRRLVHSNVPQWMTADMIDALRNVSRLNCPRCVGFGSYSAKGHLKPCSCSTLFIFRMVTTIYLLLRDYQGNCSHFGSYAATEFLADVSSVSRACATPAIFHDHIVNGKPYAECCRRLSVNRGTFFHSLYRMEDELGQLYLKEGLYPIYDYFRTKPVNWLSRGRRHTAAACD